MIPNTEIKNLLTPMSDVKWRHWTPREDTTPKFARISAGEATLLQIGTNGYRNSYGKWYCEQNGLCGDLEYSFHVDYQATGVDCQAISISAMLTWIDKNGTMLRKEYVDQLSCFEDNWKRFQRTVVSPAGTDSLVVELIFRWDAKGSVAWRNPMLHETCQNPATRKVKVATTSILSRHEPKKNLEAMVLHIDEAGREKADIICLTETFYGMFSDVLPIDICQSIPGALTDTIAAKAKEYSAYIIFSMYEKDGRDIFNTAVLIDRQGELIGKYRKVHLPHAEAEDGVTPGHKYIVFDTDFGKIGILVCWDQAFPEAARITADMGAEIIFIPTIGDEPIQTATRAKDNGVYVVVAGMYGPASSRIIDPYGNVAATVESQNPDAKEGVCTLEIDLEKHHYTNWLSLGPCLSEAKSVYRKERRIDTYHTNSLL